MNPLAALRLGDIDLARLAPDEQAELMALAENRLGGESLDAFIRRTRPLEPPPRHLQILIEAFERARMGAVRVCVSMPPRSGKSTTIRSAIAWWLSHSPADLCAYVTYNSDIAYDQSYKARAEAQRVGVQLASDRKSADDWATVAGGGLRAAGIGAGITGRGVTGFIVVDDPFKGREDADSPVMRDKVWDAFNDDILSRLEGWASVIVCHTRWGEDDLIGRLEDEGGWEIISIPAIAEDAVDVLGRPMGESFWPQRHQFSVEELAKIKKRNPYGFASLYQQRPVSRGQRRFGDVHYYDPTKINLEGCTAIIGVDPAASEKTSADWSVAVLMAIRNARNYDKATGYILNVLRRQCSIPQFARELLAFQRSKGGYNAPIAVEAVGAFKAVPQILREHAPGIKLIELASPQELHGDKFLRSEGIAYAWNDDPPRLLVPNNSPPWLEEYLKVFRRFTGVKDKQDDDVDATAHAWNTAVGGPPAVKRGSYSDPSAYGARG